MRRLLVVALLLAGLCAPPAVLAQVGGSAGVTSPSSSNVFTTTVQAGTTATYDPLVLSPRVKGAGAFTGTFTSSDLTANRTFTFPNYTGTALLSSTANEPDTANSVWANTGSFLFEGPTANGLETELDVVDPTADRTIYLPDASGTVLLGGDSANTVGELGVSPHMTFTATGSYFAAQVYETAQINTSSITVSSSGGSREVVLYSQETGRSAIFRLRPDGGILTNWAVETVTYIQGGFAIDGTTLSVPASTVKVTVVDTTASITDGDIQVCGARTAEESAVGFITCNTLDFAGGGGNLTTADAFLVVTHIKASSFVGLGGAGDETVAAEFTTGAVSILSATNLVGHAKSAYPSGYTPAMNLVSYKCLDLQGCTLDLATAPAGSQAVTIMMVSGTTALSAADSATMKVSASHSLDAYDSISFVYSPADALWVQTSVSVN